MHIQKMNEKTNTLYTLATLRCIFQKIAPFESKRSLIKYIFKVYELTKVFSNQKMCIKKKKKKKKNLFVNLLPNQSKLGTWWANPGIGGHFRKLNI